MLLIIFLGLIAKLAFVSADCDLGPSDVTDFDFVKATFTGYVVWHTPNLFDNNLDCVFVSMGPPEGDITHITITAYDKRLKSLIIIPGYAFNPNSNGYFEVNGSVPTLNGRYHDIATDFATYGIVKICPYDTDTTEVYVVLNSTHPDEATMKVVRQEMLENNIQFSQLKRRKTRHCKW